MRRAGVETDLGAYVDERMAHRHVPGVVVGMVQGEEDLVVARGVTSVDHPLDVDVGTLFQIGSRTKTFTGTALMQQVEAGKLHLDAPLVTYLPEFTLSNPDYAPRVTPRHLLTHTAGWLGDFFLASPIRVRGDEALARMVDALAQAPCLTPPGEIFSYNNAAFGVAGRLLEALTGQTYEEAIQRLVLEPLGMHHTTFFAEDVVTERTASGHIVRDGTPTVARPWGISRSSHPAGGIISDTQDQLRYARFHLGDGTTPGGERLLSAETLTDMQSGHAPGVIGRDAVGLPWLLGSVGGTRTVGHGGGMNGQMSEFMLVPERDFAISVFTNSDTGALLCGDVVRWVLDRVLDLRVAPLTPIRVSREQLDEYTGAYAFGLVKVERDGEDLLLRREPIPGSELMAEAPPPVRVGFYDEDCIFDRSEPASVRGKFLREADGHIRHLHWGGRLIPRFEGGESWKTFLPSE
jgi:CubicO group peptidase (beta-lactamase class C family)